MFQFVLHNKRTSTIGNNIGRTWSKTNSRHVRSMEVGPPKTSNCILGFEGIKKLHRYMHIRLKVKDLYNIGLKIILPFHILVNDQINWSMYLLASMISNKYQAGSCTLRYINVDLVYVTNPKTILNIEYSQLFLHQLERNEPKTKTWKEHH